VHNKNESGFTLLEVMLVVFILSMLAVVAIPRLAASGETARQKADILTGREVKSALDRYQIERGDYPKIGELHASSGEISGAELIPTYIKRLDTTVTQQNIEEGKKGFGITELVSDGNSNTNPQNIIMILLTVDGSAAEVTVYDKTLTRILWSSI